MKYLLFLIFLSLAVQGEESDFPPAVKAAEKSIVKFSIKYTPDQKWIDSATGFLLEDPNHPEEVVLVTNFHVIEQVIRAKFLHLQTRSGRKLNFKKIRHLSYLDDLAVLEVEGVEEGNFLKLGSVQNDEVYVLGFSIEKGFRKMKGTDGIAFDRGDGKIENANEKGLRFSFEDEYYYEDEHHNAWNGMSGSPFLNKQGEVFGVLRAGGPLFDDLNASPKTSWQETLAGDLLEEWHFLAEKDPEDEPSRPIKELPKPLFLYAKTGTSADLLRKLLKTKVLPSKNPGDLIREEESAAIEQYELRVQESLNEQPKKGGSEEKCYRAISGNNNSSTSLK